METLAKKMCSFTFFYITFFTHCTLIFTLHNFTLFNRLIFYVLRILPTRSRTCKLGHHTNRCVNNLPRVVTWQSNGGESNPRPRDHWVRHTTIRLSSPTDFSFKLQSDVECWLTFTSALWEKELPSSKPFKFMNVTNDVGAELFVDFDWNNRTREHILINYFEERVDLNWY